MGGSIDDFRQAERGDGLGSQRSLFVHRALRFRRALSTPSMTVHWSASRQALDRVAQELRVEEGAGCGAFDMRDAPPRLVRRAATRGGGKLTPHEYRSVWWGLEDR